MFDHCRGVLWRLNRHFTKCVMALKVLVEKIKLEDVRTHMCKCLGKISFGEANECLVVRYSKNQIRLYAKNERVETQPSGETDKQDKKKWLTLGEPKTVLSFKSKVKIFDIKSKEKFRNFNFFSSFLNFLIPRS